MDMHAFMDELEARFDEVRSRELEELIDELTDAERASVTLSARLAGADGLVNLCLRGGSVVVGEVLDSTRSWVLLRGVTGDALVMLSAIVGAWPLGRSVARESSIRGGVGVGHVLRELSARGVDVAIDSDCGDHRGSSTRSMRTTSTSPSVVRPSAMTVVMMRAGRPCRWRWRGFVDSACLASVGHPTTERVPPSGVRVSQCTGPG